MNKIIEAFKDFEDLPTKEGTNFVKEVQKIDEEYSSNFAEGFYFGYKSRECEEEIRSRGEE